MIAFIRSFLKKSQMNLFDHIPTHTEVHRREGTTRHLASGATVAVAQTMAKVQVRGKEGPQANHGEKVYYRTPDMNRKKKGTIVSGTHETGYEIKPVRQGFTLNPPHIHDINREHIWTQEEHADENKKSDILDGRHIKPQELNRRAAIGMPRIGMTENEVVRHPRLVILAKKALSGLARKNNIDPNYTETNGILYNPTDTVANDLYSEYVAKATQNLRTTTSTYSNEEIKKFKDFLDGKIELNESKIALSYHSCGKGGAKRWAIARSNSLKREDSYDTQGEDDYESGMREIAAEAATPHASEAPVAKQKAVSRGIAEHLEALEDPTAASIIRHHFGFGDQKHRNSFREIAASLNKIGSTTATGEKWNAENTQARMQSALVRLGKTKGVKDLLQFLKSMREELDEQDMLKKSHIKEYTREDGTLVHSHEDKRIKKHNDLLAHQNNHGEQIHTNSKLKHGNELIASLRDNHTKQQVLDAEDETHAAHKDWEKWKEEHGSGKGKEKPMAERLPGDHSGLLQVRLFKARRHKMYLIKSKQDVATEPLKKSCILNVAYIIRKGGK